VTRAVSLRKQGDAVELLSGSCLFCGPCRRHLLDHCAAPREREPFVVWESGEAEVELRAWLAVLTAVDVVAHSGQAIPRVGVIGSGRALRLVGECLEAGGTRTIVAETAPGTATDGDEARRLSSVLRSASTGTAGPPDIVLTTDGELALAARLVRRGGSVASLGATAGVAPMASLVQRELTVLPARDRVGTALAAPHVGVIDGWTRREERKHG
jgi:hypothetical protein